YGAGNDISGAVAQADALGIFGQQGIFAAAWWDLGQGSDYVNAAVDVYLNYDGKGGHFGTRSIAAKSDDIATAAIYASTDDAQAKSIKLVLINRSADAVSADVQFHNRPFHTAAIYQLTSAAPAVKLIGREALTTPNSFATVLPACSVSLAVLEQ